MICLNRSAARRQTDKAIVDGGIEMMFSAAAALLSNSLG
jgi:hypothetical protein